MTVGKRKNASVCSLAGGLDLPVRQTIRGEAAQTETSGNGHGHTARGRHSDGTIFTSEASSGTCIRKVFAACEFTRAVSVDTHISPFERFREPSVDRYTLYLTGDVGVQSGGVRGHIGLRVGAGPCQPGECPGVQGAISKHARDTILGANGQAEPPADYQPSFDLHQGVRAA